MLGNPPYNGYAGIGVDEERELSDAYRTASRTRQPQGQGLNDLYVRFFRMAERRIVEQTGKGVVCYISNYSWLDGLSFPAMRERYLDVFDQIWIDNLNGDRYKTGKLTPEGKPDPSVFSTEWNREGIQVGTAVALMVRRERHRENSDIHYRSLWGTTKHRQLINSLDSGLDDAYEAVEPAAELGFPFVPAVQHPTYLQWPRLPDIFPVSFPGVKTSRDDVVVDVDRDRLVARMEQYFDPDLSDADIERLMPGAMESTKRFNANAVRAHLVKRGFLPENVMRYAYRPFDVRWLYWEPETKLLDEKRPDYIPHVFEGNVWIEARQRLPQDTFDRGLFSSVLSDQIGNGMSSWFPLSVSTSHSVQLSTMGPFAYKPNISETAYKYLQGNAGSHESVFYHSLSTMHASTYRVENAGALRQDWPRVPLPVDGALLSTSADLGRQLAALLDVEQDVRGVTSGRIRPELREIAVLAKIGDGGINPDTDDLKVSVGWGRGGNGRPVMPGRGRSTERALSPEEAKAIRDAVDPMGLAAHDPLGSQTVDVFLNDEVFWRNVPERVWEYSLGGYQVLKKWLSYRETAVLGRNLKVDEARTFTQIARRIAAILLFEPELDANYQRCAAETWDWNAAAAKANQPRLWTDD